MLRRCWMVGMCLGFLLLTLQDEGRGQAGQPGTSNEQKQLEGRWRATQGNNEVNLEFKGNKFILRKKDELYAQGTFTIDPTKTPKSMDLTVEEGAEGAKKFVGKTSRAIYAIEGTQLKWSANEPGKEERPESFPANPLDAKSLYLIFDRQK